MNSEADSVTPQFLHLHTLVGTIFGTLLKTCRGQLLVGAVTDHTTLFGLLSVEPTYQRTLEMERDRETGSISPNNLLNNTGAPHALLRVSQEYIESITKVSDEKCMWDSSKEHSQTIVPCVAQQSGFACVAASGRPRANHRLRARHPSAHRPRDRFSKLSPSRSSSVAAQRLTISALIRYHLLANLINCSPAFAARNCRLL